MDADARGGAVRGDNAHCGAAIEGMEELDELLRNLHVAQEESQSPMRRNVERLGDMKGRDVILLLTPLQSTLCHEQWGCRR